MNMRLMIVDDHPGVRQLIRLLLATREDEVCECASGEEAVKRVASFKPERVTMDVSMPGVGGFEATRAIREAVPSACVLIVTSYDRPEMRQAAVESGASGFVVKENLTELPALLGRTKNDAVP